MMKNPLVLMFIILKDHLGVLEAMPHVVQSHNKYNGSLYHPDLYTSSVAQTRFIVNQQNSDSIPKV